MSDPHQAILAWLQQARCPPRTLVLLLDYDGTLVPLADRPDLARLPPSVRMLLVRLAGRPGIRLGVISGRSLDELQRIVRVAGIDYAGTNGLELRLQGCEIHHPEARRAKGLLAEVKAHLDKGLSAYQGVWVEAKPFGLTLHYRQVPLDQQARLRASAEMLLQPWAGGLRVDPGPMALEIVPDLGWTKGTAVRMMIDQAGLDRPAVCYAGDHANDAAAFDTVAALGGISIGIGQDAPPSAQFRLPEPAALHALLADLLAQLPSHPNSQS